MLVLNGAYAERRIFYKANERSITLAHPAASEEEA